MLFVGEREFELSQRTGPLMASVGHRQQISRRKMALTVCCIRRGRDRCGIGRPHRRRGKGGGADMWFGALHIGCETRQPRVVWSVERHEESLVQTKPQIGAHFLDAL